MNTTNDLQDYYNNKIKNACDKCFTHSIEEVDRMINLLNAYQNDLMNNNKFDTTQMNVHETKTTISNEFKQLHQNLGKFSKHVDKTLPSNLDSIVSNTINNNDNIKSMIIEEWLREGHVALAEQLMEKCDDMKFESDSIVFLEIRNLVESLQNHNVDPCLQWLRDHQTNLPPIVYTNLRFKLHRLKYLLLLQENVMIAITYAQKHIVSFHDDKPNEVQQLAGCLIYAPTLPSSPYNDLISPQAWLEVEYEFTTEYCRIMGFASDSPLYLCARASRVVIPKLLKYNQLRARIGENTNFSVQLGKEFQFHSTFVCPVTKEESSEPLLLECGHCISRKAMESILENGRGSKSFKCPYCPQTQSTKRVLALHI